jgi:hypothetical protein
VRASELQAHSDANAPAAIAALTTAIADEETARRTVVDAVQYDTQIASDVGATEVPPVRAEALRILQASHALQASLDAQADAMRTPGPTGVAAQKAAVVSPAVCCVDATCTQTQPVPVAQTAQCTLL